jgi:DNA-binding protein
MGLIRNINIVKKGRKKIMAEETTEKGTTEEKRTDENVIYVGKKPPMSYVLAVVTQFNSGSAEVVIKARGRSISTAVDTAEIVRNRFVTDAELIDVKIGTEVITNEEEGRTSNVSSIEIILTTKKKSKKANG